METVIVSVVCIALILFGAVSLAHSALLAADTVGTSWREMESSAGERARTELSLLDTSSEEQGAVLEVTLENEGSTRLSGFPGWDVVIQYYDSDGDYHIQWLPYSASEPGANQWTVSGIFMEAPKTPEIFEPGILNPGEEVVIRARVSPPVEEQETMMVVSTPNGVVTSITFD